MIKISILFSSKHKRQAEIPSKSVTYWAFLFDIYFSIIAANIDPMLPPIVSMAVDMQ